MGTTINNDGTVYHKEGWLFLDNGIVINENANERICASEIYFDFSQETKRLARTEVEQLPEWLIGSLDVNMLGVDLGVIDPPSLPIKYGDENSIDRPELHEHRLLLIRF